MAGGTGSKGETEAMVDDVANNLKNITTLIPDLQRTLDQQKRANAELEREKRDAAKAAADQLSAHARAAETKEKQAEGEKKKADAQIAQLTAQLKAMTGERDGALADAEQKQGSLNEQLAWRQSANEPTITFLQAMMAHKLLTGCAPTSALGDAEFAGLANVQKNIESNKIPDLQRAARELAEVKEGLQAAGFLADAKVAVSANQVRSRRRALAPVPATRAPSL